MPTDGRQGRCATRAGPHEQESACSSRLRRPKMRNDNGPQTYTDTHTHNGAGQTTGLVRDFGALQLVQNIGSCLDGLPLFSRPWTDSLSPFCLQLDPIGLGTRWLGDDGRRTCAVAHVHSGIGQNAGAFRALNRCCRGPLCQFRGWGSPATLG